MQPCWHLDFLPPCESTWGPAKFHHVETSNSCKLWDDKWVLFYTTRSVHWVTAVIKNDYTKCSKFFSCSEFSRLLYFIFVSVHPQIVDLTKVRGHSPRHVRRKKSSKIWAILLCNFYFLPSHGDMSYTFSLRRKTIKVKHTILLWDYCNLFQSEEYIIYNHS